MIRVLLFSAIIGMYSAGLAQTQLSVQGAGRKFPVAMPVLCNGGTQGTTPQDIPKLITRDLDLSGFFDIIPQKSHIEAQGKCNIEGGIAYTDWSVIGVEGLVKGVVEEANGRLRVRLFLHDVQKQEVVLGKEYEVEPGQFSKAAHKFANEIMKFFTGEYGVFGTQISFSGRVGRFKELFVMDMDGSNIKQLTNERALAISSSWDPTASKIVYTSYRSRVPDLFIYDLASKLTKQITRGSDLEIGAHFSPDGRTLAVSRTDGNDSNILLLNLDGTTASRVTPPNRAIDVSPVFSPDGSSILFCSNRAGGPQIYKMGRDGSSPQRVSFVSSNYCTSPVWSPKGDKIAFVCRADGNFQIFVSDADGGNPLQLTSMGSNEDPDWSPDGRYLVFATTSMGPNFQLAMMRADGSNIRELTKSRFGDYEPSWAPVLP